MGQRNATYIISLCPTHEKVFPIYNQWNHISIQPMKLIRGIKRVTSLVNAEDWELCMSNRKGMFGNAYFQACGFSPDTPSWVGGMYGGKITEAYQEDNNNGWNIVCFERKDFDVSVRLFCVAGDEDGEPSKDYSLQEYFGLDDKTEETAIAELESLVTWDVSLRHLAAELIAAGKHEEPNPDYFPRF